MPSELATELVGNRTRSKISRRVLPFLCLLYLAAYLDRANVAFAKLTMTADLHFSEAVYGFGAGIFFLGYLLLEIPGALIVERWGARRWFARILVTWGLCTIVVGFVRTPLQFYGARFLLGVAEAGFYPGIIVYLTHWFARRDRAQAMAGFIVAIPVSLALGAPISALILKLQWLGLPGWRWVFILEGLPAIVLGMVTFFYLTDRPRDATWLEPEERAWITQELEREKAEKISAGRVSVWRAFQNRSVLLSALSICLANLGSYVFVFWLPTTIHQAAGFSPVLSALYSALPLAVAVGFVLWSGRAADRSGRPKLQTSAMMVLAGLCLMLSVVRGQPFALVMVWLCLTAGFIYAWPPPFWVLPTLILGGPAEAASIGLINMMAGMGGFLGPSIVGYLLTAGHSNRTATAVLSTGFFAAALIVQGIRVPDHRGAEKAPL
ncbi:MAG TPA: MFS transporter [Terriglobia bacterium]|nr:MFS transporter [Terriglobia bacterium]